jgi:hypothetical protein
MAGLKNKPNMKIAWSRNQGKCWLSVDYTVLIPRLEPFITTAVENLQSYICHKSLLLDLIQSKESIRAWDSGFYGEELLLAQPSIYSRPIAIFVGHLFLQSDNALCCGNL